MSVVFNYEWDEWEYVFDGDDDRFGGFLHWMPPYMYCNVWANNLSFDMVNYLGERHNVFGEETFTNVELKDIVNIVTKTSSVVDTEQVWNMWRFYQLVRYARNPWCIGLEFASNDITSYQLAQQAWMNGQLTECPFKAIPLPLQPIFQAAWRRLKHRLKQKLFVRRKAKRGWKGGSLTKIDGFSTLYPLFDIIWDYLFPNFVSE